MISKQTVAFVMGGIMVAVALAAFSVYTEQHEGEIESDASGGNNSPHSYVDNSKYDFQLVSVEQSPLGYVTKFYAKLDVPKLGYYLAYIGDVQVKLGETSFPHYVVPDNKSSLMTVYHTDPYHSGVALLEELNLEYHVAELGTEYELEFSTYSGKYGDLGMISFGKPIPDGTPVVLVYEDMMKTWYTSGGVIKEIDPDPTGVDLVTFIINGYTYKCKINL